jgi:hypothetical protein
LAEICTHLWNVAANLMHGHRAFLDDGVQELLVGRGQMPFEGGPLELLHSIVQKRPMPVHEVRRDVPQVRTYFRQVETC